MANSYEEFLIISPEKGFGVEKPLPLGIGRDRPQRQSMGSIPADHWQINPREFPRFCCKLTLDRNKLGHSLFSEKTAK